VLVGVDHHVHPGPQAEFGQHSRDMGLDRALKPAGLATTGTTVVAMTFNATVMIVTGFQMPSGCRRPARPASASR
jgi:hypothetical protein